MMPTPAKIILVIDDEPAIRRLTRTILQAEGFKVVEAGDGESGLVAAAQHQPDLILLDLGLPDMDGMTVLARLREWTDSPVIILTVRDDPEEKVAALDSGADDYVTKPFHSGELLARIRAVAKRRHPTEAETVWERGELRMDLLQRQLACRGERLPLTPTEFHIFRILAKNEGCVVTKRAIINGVWGGPSKTTTEDHLRVHLASLRKKLREAGADGWIRTEQGIGYRLDGQSQI